MKTDKKWSILVKNNEHLFLFGFINVPKHKCTQWWYWDIIIWWTWNKSSTILGLNEKVWEK